jgi:DNA repair exonuclease SbcCD ATPase subunit
MTEQTGTVQSPGNPTGSDEKDTNRLFTQSDFDKALARETAKLTEKYKDYEAIKKTAEDLTAKEAEAQKARMSEVEKARAEAEDAKKKLAQTESERNTLERQVIKSNILADPRFVTLPVAYRKAIEGDTEEAIKGSAEKILAEFNEDLKRLGVKPDSFGIPTDKRKDTLPKPPTSPLSDALAKRFNLRQKT